MLSIFMVIKTKLLCFLGISTQSGLFSVRNANISLLTVY